jgi:hypothetical protein
VIGAAFALQLGGVGAMRPDEAARVGRLLAQQKRVPIRGELQHGVLTDELRDRLTAETAALHLPVAGERVRGGRR